MSSLPALLCLPWKGPRDPARPLHGASTPEPRDRLDRTGPPPFFSAFSSSPRRSKQPEVSELEIQMAELEAKAAAKETMRVALCVFVA